jgi:hypothetical protein
MNEEEFDSWMGLRPFRTSDALEFEAQAGRCTLLGMALWGRTSEDLQRQLVAPHPRIPAGYDLVDYRKLQQTLQAMANADANPRFKWLPRGLLFSETIVVGTQAFTTWEARYEIVRRAIDYLETR